MNDEAKKKFTRVCLNCGITFTANSSCKIYCSDECKTAHASSVRYTKTCKACGQDFETAHNQTKFCCSKCSDAYKYAVYKGTKKPSKKKKKELEQINDRARNLNMTYGQYQAMKFLQEHAHEGIGKVFI